MLRVPDASRASTERRCGRHLLAEHAPSPTLSSHAPAPYTPNTLVSEAFVRGPQREASVFTKILLTGPRHSASEPIFRSALHLSEWPTVSSILSLCRTVLIVFLATRCKRSNNDRVKKKIPQKKEYFT